MANTQERRVEEALSQLVDRLLPIDPEENGDAADDRYYNALDRAKEIIERADASATPLDAQHVSEQIRKRLVRQNRSPDLALSYSRLFSQLLSQPLLTQRAAILQFLNQLSDHSPPPTARIRSTSPQRRSPTRQNPLRLDQRSPTRMTTRLDHDRNHEQTQQIQLDTDRVATSSIYPVPSTRNAREIGRRGLTAESTKTEKADRPQSTALPVVKHNRDSLTRSFGNLDVQEQPVRRAAARDVESKSNHHGQTRRASSLRPGPSAKSTQPPPTEAELLRDLPFTLQGISSVNMTFTPPLSLALPSNLPTPLLSLLHQLAEPALLYKELAAFVESPSKSLTSQSLSAAISLELRSYLGLVASLEGQIRRGLATLDEGDPKRALAKAGVTLKRCVIWTREATLGLRIMSSLASESKTRKGGQLITHIHNLASLHGDPVVESFSERLLTHVTQPFYDMLRGWIYDGELSDPHLEFFVLEQSDEPDTDANKSGASSVWESKYKMVESLIPSIITASFAKKVFLIGKSLNFIRHGCYDSEWIEQHSKSTSKELRYGDTEKLETSIDEAYKTTMAHLIDLMNNRFKLQDHLSALKRYLLLGQGDFIGLLMESLASNLDRPANSQYRHTLTAQLEHARLNSNAQWDSPEVLQRLDARMLELSHGEIGWDVFTLEYKIEAPLDVIVTPYGSKQYLKVFNFLWRVKRVEYALGSTWRRCMTGARGVLGSVAKTVGPDWKIARCALTEMIHFVNQLQYYILFEVIEASWDQLHDAINTPGCTLDDIIEAHAKYLRSITRKGLLGSSSMDFAAQLHELLKVMLAYKEVVDGLYSFSIAEYARQQEGAPASKSRKEIQRKTLSDVDDEMQTPDKASSRVKEVISPIPPGLLGKEAASDTDILPALRQRLGSLAADFRSMVCVLLDDLAHQPDMELRFLGVVMNFNDTYKVVRKSRRKPTYPESERRKGKEREHRANDEGRPAAQERR